MGVFSEKTSGVNLFSSLAERNRCTGCMACATICPSGALVPKWDKHGFLYPDYDMSKCLHCKKCENVCPVLHTGDKRERFPGVSAAWVKDGKLRRQSTSGGIFAAIASRILADGGVVYGAIQQGFRVLHAECLDIHQLAPMQGSKYQSGNPAGIYRQVQKRLREGKTVFFSGLPCQVAALTRFLGDESFTGTLFTSDVICGGVPSIHLQELYRRLHPDVTEILRYREKSEGWLSSYRVHVRLNSGETRCEGAHHLLLQGFSSRLFHRESCLHCPFATARHPSDITIGDLWGDRRFPDEHFAGISALIVNSQQGEKLLSLLNNIERHDADADSFLTHNTPFWNILTRITPTRPEKTLAALLMRLSMRMRRDLLSPYLLASCYFSAKFRWGNFVMQKNLRAIRAYEKNVS